MNSNKVLLVGWDAAEWKVIHELIAQGQMPNVQSLIEKGASGNIRTLSPPLSPMLWTSIATGKLADKHGVLGFLDTNEETGEVHPINSTARKSHAIWNILNSKKYKSNVINWWPSDPVDPINGTMVSNFFCKEKRNEQNEWPVGEHAVHPKEKTETFKSLRVPAERINAHDILKFIPDAAMIDQETDPRIGILQKYIAETLSVQKVAEHVLEDNDWDFTAVYFDSMDKLSHTFMKYRAPQMSNIPDDEFELYKDVVNAMYVMFDGMLGALLEKIDDKTTVILLSDHGFHADELRPKSLPKFNASIALEHNPNGVLIMSGPAIEQGVQLHSASLLDITPTLLRIFDLPIGEDMDGKVLESCLTNSSETQYIPSWEKETGDFSRHQSDYKTGDSDHVTQQLIDLGYIEELDGNQEEVFSKISKDSKYNLSKVYSSTGRSENAIKLLEELYEVDKADARWNIDLIKMYIENGKTEQASTILKNFKKFNVEKTIKTELLEVILLQKAKKYDEAIELCKSLIAASPRFVQAHIELAATYRLADQLDLANAAYQKAFELDPDSSRVLDGLAVVNMRQKEFESAADYALQSIELDYHNPTAHYHFGKALFKLGIYRDAAHALEVCLTINPAVNRARNLLLTIYQEYLPSPEKYEMHQAELKAYEYGEITIVSGIPRSGTSMMMQLLEAGGEVILTDNIRQADETNPKGYYEYEPVKNTAQNKDWLFDAKGKTVKVIAQLLTHLSQKFKYKVIFMLRDIDEIILSQETMLMKTKPGKMTMNYDVTLASKYQEGLDIVKSWEQRNNNVEILYLQYKDVINNPDTALLKVQTFLGKELDIEKMKTVIDKSLYRSKVNEA